MQKEGGVIGCTISINKINKHGITEKYLKPLMLNKPWSLRLHCVFDTSTSNYDRPYSVQLDVFCRSVTINITESHVLLMTDLLKSIQNKCKVENNGPKDERKSSDSSTTSGSSKIEIS